MSDAQIASSLDRLQVLAEKLRAERGRPLTAAERTEAHAAYQRTVAAVVHGRSDVHRCDTCGMPSDDPDQPCAWRHPT